MSDIVERLTAIPVTYRDNYVAGANTGHRVKHIDVEGTLALCAEAAAEIASLRGEVERLKASELAWKIMHGHEAKWNALPQSEKEAALQSALDSTVADQIKAEDALESAEAEAERLRAEARTAREQALEEAAKVAQETEEREFTVDSDARVFKTHVYKHPHPQAIAKAIRALKSSDTALPVGGEDARAAVDAFADSMVAAQATTPAPRGEAPSEEEIARAIFDSDQLPSEGPGCTWDEIPDHWKLSYRRRARAVLALIKEKGEVK